MISHKVLLISGNGLQIEAGQEYGRCPLMSATIYGRKDTDCKPLLPDLTDISCYRSGLSVSQLKLKTYKSMEHTNKVIISVLREEFADYDNNTWHYDSQYKMIEKAIIKVAEEAERKRYPHCWGKMTWILEYEPGKEPFTSVCSCSWGSKECLRLTRETAINKQNEKEKNEIQPQV